ncbi:MAG: alpha-ketoacid dehydrogenase subunit beta [Flavobacteriaceae bacterium]|jgi:acetoin:2,6-dichlorophenolindophenol oxidoreductase subunit beta|nr:alpha-ketoacid dehydrogenase subunit beta [Flavobacteriaceae bacterium]MBT6169129.1 alpha-ketoacid dehydrogenase subunit beta [Flavobacteriaceae bacterium]MBT6447803.1 alpha-ketoacid dehydrogenase subunit beta [Flavobacteriaceae bacterium]
MSDKIKYSKGIHQAFTYLLENHEEFFVIGQGLWSPWYVGETMKDLDKKFGKSRVIDTPVSELAVTGATIGASITGFKPLVVHPRVDFMLLAIDQIVTQAAKWRHMFGNNSSAPATFRAIINRGGEQGAQHSQSLHSWFAHIPGLKVVMPYDGNDARDLLISSVLADDPVVFMDDRWLYDETFEDKGLKLIDLKNVKPKVVKEGTDITIVGIGFTVKKILDTEISIANLGVSSEIIDLRLLNPIDYSVIITSVKKTKRLMVVDGDWSSCGLASEIITSVMENIPPNELISSPRRLTLANAPAPTSKILEDEYYITSKKIIDIIKEIY